MTDVGRKIRGRRSNVDASGSGNVVKIPKTFVVLRGRSYAGHLPDTSSATGVIFPGQRRDEAKYTWLTARRVQSYPNNSLMRPRALEVLSHYRYHVVSGRFLEFGFYAKQSHRSPTPLLAAVRKGSTIKLRPPDERLRLKKTSKSSVNETEPIPSLGSSLGSGPHFLAIPLSGNFGCARNRACGQPFRCHTSSCCTWSKHGPFIRPYRCS